MPKYKFSDEGPTMDPIAFPQATHDFYKTNGGDYAFHTTGPSLTRQEFADECDINSIMARYETTGALPANNVEPVYVDWTDMPQDLMGSMQRLDEASRAFMTLPAKVRREFDNNAHVFVDFAMDPNNLEQMREWGLAPKPPEQVFVPVDKPEPSKAPSSPPGPEIPPK